MKEHNTNFYSLENIKETLESCKDFLDGEEVYYHIGALRYAYDEVERLNNIIDELEEWLEEEQDRLARETSHIYEDSLGKTRLVNENIYEEVQKIKDKLKELKGSDK